MQNPGILLMVMNILVILLLSETSYDSIYPDDCRVLHVMVFE